MERREAVKYISILLGGAFVGGEALLSGCKSNTGKHTEFTPDDIAYLNEIGETILPQTSTPGAKAANVGQFMTVMVNDCYEEGDQKAFHEGMDKLNDASKKKFDKDFMAITPEQRNQLLVEVDKESKDYQKDKVNKFNDEENRKEKDEIAKGNRNYKKQRISPHYFMMMKQLTLLGYFTSKEGMTNAVNYKPVPGSYKGCIPYKKGDKLLV
jgi:hypothetical protein